MIICISTSKKHAHKDYRKAKKLVLRSFAVSKLEDIK